MMSKRNKRRVFTDTGLNIDFAEAPQGDLAQQIATRQTQFTSLANYLPNPDSVLKALGKSIEVYRELLNDPRVASAVLSRRAALTRMKWRVNDNKAGARVTRYAKDLLAYLDVQNIISEMFEGILFGYKPLELLWEERGGQWWPTASSLDQQGKEVETEPWGVIGKPPEWFTFDEWNRLLLKTKANFMGELVPNRKFVLARNNNSYQNPFGEPLLSKVFWPVTFKKGGQKFWVNFAEKYGMPWATASYKAGTQQGQIDKLLDMLEGMVQDGVAVFEESQKLNLLEASKTSSVDTFERLVSFCNMEISTAVLGGNLTTEVSGGSLAAASAHLEVRADIVDSDANVICDAFNQILDWAVDFNFGENATRPTFELYDDSKDENKQSERDEKLFSLGVRFTPDYFKRTYNLEDDEFEMAKAAPEAPAGQAHQNGPDGNPLAAGAPQAAPGASQAAPGAAPAPGAPAQFAEGAQPIDGQELLDGLLEKLASLDFTEQSAELLRPVFELVAGSSNYAEVQEGLVKLYPKMKTETMQNVLGKAIFLSEAIGVKSLLSETESEAK